MSPVGDTERVTQNRVGPLFRHELNYRYLGDWTERLDNTSRRVLLTPWLVRCGYSSEQMSMALHKLRTEADKHSRGLYGNNQAVYTLLRYGVPVKTEAGKPTETVHLINWCQPDHNDFAKFSEGVEGVSAIQGRAGSSG